MTQGTAVCRELTSLAHARGFTGVCFWQPVSGASSGLHVSRCMTGYQQRLCPERLRAGPGGRVTHGEIQSRASAPCGQGRDASLETNPGFLTVTASG